MKSQYFSTLLSNKERNGKGFKLGVLVGFHFIKLSMGDGLLDVAGHVFELPKTRFNRQELKFSGDGGSGDFKQQTDATLRHTGAEVVFYDVVKMTFVLSEFEEATGLGESVSAVKAAKSTNKFMIGFTKKPSVTYFLSEVWTGGVASMDLAGIELHSQLKSKTFAKSDA